MEKSQGGYGGLERPEAVSYTHLLPHPFAKFKAGAVRQGYIQYQQIILAIRPQRIRFFQRSGNIQFKSMLLERKGKPVDQAQIIFQK